MSPRPKKNTADQASAVVALLDPPIDEPVPPEEGQYVPDDEPSPDDVALAAAFVADHVPDEPPSRVLCPHCAGTGFAPKSNAPGAFAWDELPPHALDSAPVNSKIVVVLLDGKSHAVLAGPDGAKELPKGDPAHRLPEGARIRKIGEREFLAEQMSPAEDHAPITRETTMRAIADFIPHFHPHGLS